MLEQPDKQMAAQLLIRLGGGLAAVLLFAASLFAQSVGGSANQNLTATSVGCPDAGCLRISTFGMGTVGIQVVGSGWTGNLNFYGSIDGVSAIPLPCTPATNFGQLVTGTILNGLWRCNVAGLAFAAVVLTSPVTGAPSVYLQTAAAPWHPPSECLAVLGKPAHCS